MTQTLVGQQPTDPQELAKQVRFHPFVDGPTRKLVRSWIQHDPPPQQIPWTPLAKPLGHCRVALVSSAGIARHDQPPFDQELERRDPWWSDQSWRPIPLGTTQADVSIYHLHIDALTGVALGPLEGPAHRPRDAPDVRGMVAHAGEALDHQRDPSQGPLR